jgi:hypothetical protein
MKLYSVKNRPLILISPLVILLLVIGTGMVKFFNPRPPVHQIAMARKALAEAREVKANQYFPGEYREAEEFYDSTMQEWKNQNDRFFLHRNFSKVSCYSKKAAEKANKAKECSKTAITNLKLLLTAGLDSLQNSINEFDSIIRSLPLSKDLTGRYAKGRLLFLESKTAYENRNYKDAYDKLLIASLLHKNVCDDTREFLNAYFAGYEQWIILADATIKRTGKMKSSALIVDKFAKTCMLYQNGRLKYTFGIELGSNWIGNKQYKGDNATPEGSYFILQKLNAKETKYHKALLLNYPNEADKKRFIEGKQNGTLPESSDIGGLIEIHGGGGKGFHWTNGCIALKNEDIDRVFAFTSKGTPVIIVGSLKKLSEIYNLYGDGS